jgi:DNA-binding MarR family transcriptional regulator
VTTSIADLEPELRRAVTRLYSRFRSERAEGEVPDAMLLVLLALQRQPSMSLSGLAASARVTLGSMSQSVRRLEQLGLVSKRRDELDRRKALFVLTELGTTAAQDARQHRRTWLRRRLTELSDADRDLVARAAPILLRLADS